MKELLTTGKAFTKRIDELLFKNGWSLYRLSKISCVPLSTLKNFYRAHSKSPTLSLVYKIANAFNMSILQFLDTPTLQDENVDYD